MTQLDCLVIGYNELPFARYESFLRGYGEDSPAYRDLRYSFVAVDDRKLPYLDLLNHALDLEGVPVQPFVSGEIPNLAAAYLTNFLRRHGLSCDYVNLFQQEKARLGRILDQGVGCVAITTTFYVVNLPVNDMVEFIRDRSPETPIVVGGPLISNHLRNYSGEGLEEALRDLDADYYIVDSQGEATLAHLAATLRDGRDVEEVPNLVYFAEGELRKTALRPESNSLDESYIDWTGFEHPLGPTLQTRTARSCAFKCSFCNYPTRAGKLTLASVETLERELDSVTAVGGVENVVFIDDTFNVPLPRFKDICRLLIERDYGFDWYSYFRCSNADEEAIDLMARSGCKGVFLGIESGSPRILELMNKRASTEQYRNGIARLHEHGVLTFGSFIAGFPGETAETIDETIDFIRETSPDYYRIQPWYNEPGTPIQQRAEELGIEGEGFSWSHATMDSFEAMDHIDRAFLSIRESQWLPQWSFDFWVIPYLAGRGLGGRRFDGFMRRANELLALDVANVAPARRDRRKRELMREIRELVADVPTSGMAALEGASSGAAVAGSDAESLGS